MAARLYFHIKRYPLVIGMITYGCVWTASSVFQQKILSKHRLDVKAVCRNAAVGVIFMAPLLHNWYRLVYWIFGSTITWRTSLKKSLVEQVVFGPIAVSTFFSATGLLSGASREQIGLELRSKFLTTYGAGCCFFPFVNFINHLLIPFHLKLVYQACISFVWSCFLCLVKERPLSEGKKIS